MDYNYIEVGWWDILAAPIALFWFFGITWCLLMVIVQPLLLTKNETPAQPPFGYFCRRGAKNGNYQN